MRSPALTQTDAVRRNPATCCPVCGANSTAFAEARGWGEWKRCSACTLEFVAPLRLDEKPEELFADAYSGHRPESGMDDFRRRLLERHVLMPRPDLSFWTPAFEKTVQWLRQRLSPGATIFEIGCGLGFVLETLRREGFHARGLDVAKPVVDLCRADGFQVWHGTVDNVPSNWVDPDAIVAFFMLHHVDDPLGLLRTVRRKWPAVPIALAQYGPSNLDPKRACPPRTLTRWNVESLRTLLEVAGYAAATTSITSTGAEHQMFRVPRIILKRTLFVPHVFRFARAIERDVLPRLAHPLQRAEFVVLGFGEPR